MTVDQINETKIRAPLAQLRAYWEGLRRGDALPARADINPAGISGALAAAFLVERIGPGVARLRIAGMTFTHLLGMEARGMPLSALFDPMARARLATLTDQCFLRPAVLEADLGCETGLGRPPLRGRLLMLPLAGDGGRGEMALGGLTVAGELGRAPRRLTLGQSELRALKQPVILPPSPAAPPLPAAAPYAVKPSAHGRSYLQLVDLGP